MLPPCLPVINLGAFLQKWMIEGGDWPTKMKCSEEETKSDNAGNEDVMTRRCENGDGKAAVEKT